MPNEVNALTELIATGGGGAGSGVILTLLAQRFLHRNNGPPPAKQVAIAIDDLANRVGQVESRASDMVDQLSLLNVSNQRTNELLAELRGILSNK